ncbi:TRAP transporter, 4TM/12TM fusion protein [Acetomicrobium thermoterrenum DSM 13490]|uniref:TRAP transporter, 4TM/12TM fusion protein n=1 Tax=Acetomicrobium thermoterrenum DSM 13490 TaxID=1120987 RepID=A0A1H3F307_9BACT|nr:MULTISPECIES: TRAP transporter permease [Acetomicrobium]SDX85352.1 TRAP transporter, 4TM/12TM fusion protein [Acetomicrobium thermoterrenum DSM 13490]
MRSFVYVYIVCMGLFHLYTAVFGSLEAYLQRNVHLLWVLPLTFLLFPPTKQSPKDRVPWFDWLLAFLATLPGLYVIFNYESIIYRMIQVDPVTVTQIVIGTLLVVLLLEGTRRVVGLPLAIIGALFALYMYFGHYMPGIFRAYPFSFDRIIEHFYLTDEGIFSSPLGISATYVMIFLIFGGFLEKSGTGTYFMELAEAFAGHSPGGPAKISVLSSAFFGSISGSAVANVYATGAFTIPLMKRTGYSPTFAGAVEAVASTGGQIMPPLMGAGAFIMAAFLGVPYRNIMIAAFVPAVLYYVAVLVMVHIRALKIGLKGLPREELPSRANVIKKSYLLIPLGGLVVMLLYGYTPMRAAVISIALAWAMSLFDKHYRMGPRAVIDAIHDGSKNIFIVAIACATAGIVVGSVTLTGFGFKVVSFIFSLAMNLPFLALLLVMALSIILGMGLPTTAAYIVASALTVPALVKLGFTALAANMFVFYFAVISNITPPVALAAYAASSLAGANPDKTGFQAMRLGLLAFVVPFAFCYDGGLLLQGNAVSNILVLLGGLFSAVALGCALEGYSNKPIGLLSRSLFLVFGVCCLWPMATIKLIGIVAIITLFVLARRGSFHKNDM